MFKVVTIKGIYVVKLLNTNIMKRPSAMTIFNNADALEEIIIYNNIPVVGSLKINNKKMQEYEGHCFYVFKHKKVSSFLEREHKSFIK